MRRQPLGAVADFGGASRGLARLALRILLSAHVSSGGQGAKPGCKVRLLLICFADVEGQLAGAQAWQGRTRVGSGFSACQNAAFGTPSPESGLHVSFLSLWVRVLCVSSPSVGHFACILFSV